MKKFITIALAVAVLFSFAACQNPDYLGKEVTAVSVSYSGNGVLVGQAVDPSQFSGVVTYKNGTTGAWTGGYALSGGNAYKEGPNYVFPAGYTSSAGKAVVASGAEVTGYKPTAVTINVTGATATEVNNPGDGQTANVDKTGITVTATYEKGTMTLDTSYITATVAGSSSATAANQAVTVSLGDAWKTAWGLDANAVTVVGKDDFKVNLVDAEYDSTKAIKSVAIASAGTIYAGEASKNSDWVVTVTDKDDNATILSSGYTITYLAGRDSSGNYVKGSDAVKVYATYNNICSSTVTATATEYIKSIRISTDGGAAVSDFTYTTSTAPLAAIQEDDSSYGLYVLKSGSTEWEAGNLSNDLAFSVPELKKSTSGESVVATYSSSSATYPAGKTAPTLTLKFTYKAPAAGSGV